MPTYLLHADYDRDGRVSQRPSEYALRARYPGAILIANLDLDAGRRSAAGTPILDKDLAHKGLHDGELAEIAVTVLAGTSATPDQGTIELDLANASRIRLLDGSGQVVLGAEIPTPGVSAYQLRLPLTFQTGRLPLRAEALTLPASPLSEASSAAGEPGGIRLHLLHSQPGGKQLRTEPVSLTVAPLIFPDPTCPAKWLYICTTDGNEPTVVDLDKALKDSRLRAELKLVEPKHHGGDTWLQDQFQIGYCYGARTAMPVVLHLPRLRRNTQLVPGGRNLAAWVMTNLPQRDRGLFQDFWNREVDFVDARGRIAKLSFLETGSLAAAVLRVQVAHTNAMKLETARLRALARYLAGETVDDPGVRVLSADPDKASKPKHPDKRAPRRDAGTSLRLWKWLAAGGSVAALATGGVFLWIDGDCIDQPNCIRLRDTKVQGFAAIGAGVALGGVATWLFIKDHRAHRRGGVAVVPGAGGVSVWAGWEF